MRTQGVCTADGSVFKDTVQTAQLEKVVSAVQQRGGLIKQRFDSDIMRGFSAQMPDELARELEDAAKQGHESMCVRRAAKALTPATMLSRISRYTCRHASDFVYSSSRTSCSSTASCRASGGGKHTAGVATIIS